MAKKNYQSFNGCGIDIAEHRADDLDDKAISYLDTKEKAKVLDLGCGALGFSKRVVSTETKVVAIDVADFSHKLTPGDTIQFIQADVRQLPEIVGITDTVCQRTLHYLRFNEALTLLKQLYVMTDDRLFISVSGLSSYIGECLIKKEQNIEDRFSDLSAEGQLKFGITSPVCLYSEEEFRDLLIQAGWQIDELWMSAFKNIKAVCSHR